MVQAKGSLNDLIELYEPLELRLFFPIFRDGILGLVHLHNLNIVHRNLTPYNILMINENKYKVTDYGQGINLSFQCNYQRNVNY